MTLRATNWQELVTQYREYRSLPVWGTMVRVPDRSGRLRHDHIQAIARRGKNAAMRVSKALETLEKRCGPAWPATPAELINRQERFDRLCAKARPAAQALRNFWDALIFDRDGYTCRYCGRDAFDFYRESKGSRTLWLVVDHTDRARKAPGRYEFRNCVTTCWTCNTVKGPLPEGPFLQELDSLVVSRLRLMSHNGP
jgi:5-methylcytosine-specific restriction endonuclease McrA